MIRKLVDTILKNKQLPVLSLIYFVSILIAYIVVIYPNFKEGHAIMFFCLDYNFSKILIVFFSLFITFAGIFIKNKFIKSIWYILLMYLFYSSLIYYLFNNASYLIVFQNIILLSFVFIADYINIPVPSLSLNINKYPKVLLIISVAFVVPFLYYLPHIDIRNLWLEDIYETRFEFRKISLPFTAYLESPLSRVMFPILFIYFFHKKSYKMMLIPVVGVLYIFLCGATKSLFFGLIAAILFYFGKNYIDKVKIYGYLFIFLSFAAIISMFFNNYMIVDVLIRRLLFIPPYLDNIYYQYFSGQHTYWSHTPLGLGIYHSPVDYRHSLSMFVGEKVIGIKGLNANTGIITEGYAAAGLAGVVVHSSIYALIFAYIKSLRINHIFFGIIFAYIYILNTSHLSVLLLTHGLAFLLVIFTLFLKDTETICK